MIMVFCHKYTYFFLNGRKNWEEISYLCIKKRFEVIS